MFWEVERLPLSSYTCRAHNSCRGCHSMPFAWERRSRLKGVGHGAASSSWNNSGTHGWFFQRGAIKIRRAWVRAPGLFVKKIGQWKLHSAAKRSTRALPKTSQIFLTESKWSIHSSEESLLLDNMSARWFTCVAFSERRLVWAQKRRLFASVQRHFEMRPPWWFKYDTTDLLSEHTSTWCPLMSGRNNWQACHTASISKQLMCRPDSSLDQRPKVGLPLHSAPQPPLKASVVITFLLCAMS